MSEACTVRIGTMTCGTIVVTAVVIAEKSRLAKTLVLPSILTTPFRFVVLVYH